MNEFLPKLLKGLVIGALIGAAVFTGWLAIGALIGGAQIGGAVTAGWSALAAVFGKGTVAGLFAGAYKAPLIVGLGSGALYAATEIADGGAPQRADVVYAGPAQQPTKLGRSAEALERQQEQEQGRSESLEPKVSQVEQVEARRQAQAQAPAAASLA